MKEGHSRHLAHLDCVYVFEQRSGTSESDVQEYKILGTGTHYDHHPVTLSLQLEQPRARTPKWKMSTRYLKKVKPSISRIWAAQAPEAPFFMKICHVIRFYRKYCLDKAVEFRREEEFERHELARVTAQLQEAPTDEPTQQLHTLLRDRVHWFESQKVAGQRVCARMRWKFFDDTVAKEFFNAVKERPQTSVITELEDESGVLVSDRAEVERVCVSFYSKLYTVEESSREIAAAQEETLAKLSPRLTDDMRCKLARPLTKPELQRACKPMAKNKSPGPDGIAIKFFQLY